MAQCIMFKSPERAKLTAFIRSNKKDFFEAKTSFNLETNIAQIIMKKFLKDNWVLLMILALAIFFRYWQITTMPAGLFPDEAANGLDINNIFHGQIQPFYERGNGREALFFYFLAASVALFGRGPWQHHIISAGFGVA